MIKLSNSLSALSLLWLFASCSHVETTLPTAEGTIEPTISISKPEYDYQATTEFPTLDESTIQKIIYVNPSHPDAQEKGDGTKEQPFRSIMASRAVLHDALEQGIPTKLIIAPGTYREDLRYLLNFKETDSETKRKTLVVVEGAEKGNVILSGSIDQDPELGDFRPQAWKAVEGAPGLYVNDWPFGTHVDPGPWIDSYGFAKMPGVMQRSEMVWIDGHHLRQVLAERYEWVDPDGNRGVSDHGTGKGGDKTNKPGRLEFVERVISNPATVLTDPGTFVVFTAEEVQDDLKGKVFLRLPNGLTMDQVETVEIGRWKGKAWTPMMNVLNKQNVVLRNLTITKGTMGQMCSALNISNCENFLIEDCDLSENVASGLVVSRSRVGIVRRVTANNNGGNGFGSGGSRQILFEDCETSFNNIRGAWAGWLGWHASAFKSGGVHNITIRRHISVGNYANGIWFDVYCTNILVEDSFIYGNKRMGVMFELTKPNGGPHVLRNSVVAENDNTGVYLTMASNSRVEDSLIIRNGGGGYVEFEQKNTQLLYKFRDHPQGPNSPEAWERIDISGNFFLSDLPDTRAIDYLDRKAEPMTQYDRVLTVLHSQNNQYGTTQTDAFRMPDGSWSDYAGWIALLKSKEAPVPDTDTTWDLSGLDPDRRKEFSSASSSEITRRARAIQVPLPEERIAEYWQRTDEGFFSPPYLYYEKQND
jgi:hypothetical protein